MYAVTRLDKSYESICMCFNGQSVRLMRDHVSSRSLLAVLLACIHWPPRAYSTRGTRPIIRTYKSHRSSQCFAPRTNLFFCLTSCVHQLSATRMDKRILECNKLIALSKTSSSISVCTRYRFCQMHIVVISSTRVSLINSTILSCQFLSAFVESIDERIVDYF